MKIFVIQHFQRNTKLFFKRYWNTKRFIYKRKNEKKEEKSESFCLRENVYCVVDLFIYIHTRTQIPSGLAPLVRVRTAFNHQSSASALLSRPSDSRARTRDVETMDEALTPL